MKLKIHIKNNRWAPGSFPNTAEGEAVFTITQKRFDHALTSYPELMNKVDTFVDWDTDNFESSVKDADVILTWDMPTENIAQFAHKLKWIHCIGAGVEHMLPLDWLPHDVTLTNNKGVHAAKAGEFGLMAILMLHAQLPAVITNQHNNIYDSLYSSPIKGKTVVILGTGSLGGAVAKQIQKFGVHVIGVNRSGRDVNGCDEVLKTAQLDSALARADYLFIATPDTPGTSGLLNKHRLNLLKSTAGIVNIGREAVMDYDALCDKLDNGTLAGAILDVFNPEPIAADSRLWKTKNLIITPHISADDGDAYVALTLDLFLCNLSLLLAEKPLLNPVNPTLGY